MGQGSDELEGVFGANGVDNVFWWGPKQVCDDGELVDVVFAREKRLALYHLGEDAACRPYVNLDVVFLPG